MGIVSGGLGVRLAFGGVGGSAIEEYDFLVLELG